VRYADDCVPRARDKLMRLARAQLHNRWGTEGPSGPADRSRSQITFGGGGQKPSSWAQKEKVREEPDQMSDREMNASEPLTTCRKRRNEVQTRTESLSWDEQRRSLFRTLWPPALRWQEAVTWRLSGTWEPSAPMPTERRKQKPCERRS